MSERIDSARLAAIVRGNYLDDVDNYEIASMSIELHDRRAADLSAEEREALRFAREHMDWLAKGLGATRAQLALAVLDKLLARGGS